MRARPHTPRPRRLRRSGALLVAGLVLAAASPAASAQDPAARRREIQRQRAAVASRIDALRASDKDVEDALDALNDEVRSQEADVASARQASDVADQQAAAARAAEQATIQRLGGLRDEMRRAAVDAYVRGPASDSMTILDASSLAEVARRSTFVQVVTGQRTEAADALNAAKEDLGIQRVAAEKAQQEAAARRARVEARLGKLNAAKAEQEKVSSAVEDRLDAALAEADSLAAVDRQLAADIARRQQQLASRLRNGASGAVGTVRRIGTVALTTVGGITVAAQIGPQLQQLLAAATADGLSLGGSGYRSSDAQVATRRANCGSSDYDIYQKPPSACSPPTARPGASMHEQGLAIDFTSGGSIVSSRSSPAFRWLAANAGRYGFYNLPSEPWHWSTNGN